MTTSKRQSLEPAWTMEKGKHVLRRGPQRVAWITENEAGGFEVTTPESKAQGNEPGIFETLPEAKTAAEELTEPEESAEEAGSP